MCIITVDGVTKTPIGEINDFPFKVNSIITPIKVLMMEATQYQALNYNSAKMANTPEYQQPVFEKDKKKPTWEAYQVFWANENHNKLLPILFWNNNSKRKQKDTELI
ncbi:hypothetical protein G9A89_021848 [Geosiphon pyriformis]|nr:hypothetical protein G9A89_021848 [Geosiphon pyriformis]